MAERKDRMALLSRYSKLHTFKYGQKPVYNINVEQWSADALIESYGMPTCYDLLDYYFEVSESPSWNQFSYLADKLLDSKQQIEFDKKEREARRQMAKEWLNG